MKKEYKVRIYVYTDLIGYTIDKCFDSGLFALQSTIIGTNGCLCIYDIKCSQKGLKWLISMGVQYLPLDNYQDFEIRCPKCGERIDDNMILNIYNDDMLSGYNINCNRDNCNLQKAKVTYIGE